MLVMADKIVLMEWHGFVFGLFLVGQEISKYGLS